MIQHLGIISILAMWAGTISLLRNHVPELGKLISKHAAKNDKYHILYGIVEVTVVSMFSLLIFDWFIPEFDLHPVFSISAFAVLTGTLLAAIIPDRSGWRNKMHALTSYSMAVSLMIMSITLITNPNVGSLAKISLIGTINYIAIGWIVVILNKKFFQKHMLYFQAIYFMAFHIPIIVAIYS